MLSFSLAFILHYSNYTFFFLSKVNNQGEFEKLETFCMPPLIFCHKTNYDNMLTA